MPFLGQASLTNLLMGADVIQPWYPKNISNGSYELSLGHQVFQTDSKPRRVKELSIDEEIYILPGQFALLLTEEVVNVPNDKIAFISIKATIKFEGLVNVSGFHVDSGFSGKLLFSVYNAGPSTIVLTRGTKCFPIWFADVSEPHDYDGKYDQQLKIPKGPISALAQGELASPSALSNRIDEVKHMKTKIEWVLLAIVTLLVGLTVKSLLDTSNLKAAIDYGYNKKVVELTGDSVANQLNSKINALQFRVDSLVTVIRKPKK